jgi:putative RNA 2'-phosphotransferase
MMLQVGRRYGQPVLLAVDAARMHADGHQFFATGNSVWLTGHVPPEYIRIVP